MKVLLIGILICISVGLSAQNTLLYEISGNGLTKPSYLYGTIHMICANDYNLKESVSNKLKESEQIALEIDMDDPTMTQKTMELASFKNGQTLKGIMSEANYGKLSIFFKDSLEMNLSMFDRFKPVILFSLMTSKLLTCEIKSYEMEFVKSAQMQKKELIGLETLEFQMKMFDKLSNEDITKMMTDMIDNYSKSKKEFAVLIENYKVGDVEKLLESMSKSKTNGFEEFKKALFDTRNQDWVGKIATISKEKSTFYAVGAGHLGGENGVLNLLKKEGFMIKAIE